MTPSEQSFFNKIEHRELQKIYTMWLELGPEFLHRDFSPIIFKNYLPNLFLLDVEQAPVRFKYRLMGTEIDQHIGKSLTGKYVDEFRKGKTLEELTAIFSKVAFEGASGYYKSRMETEVSPIVTYHRLILPLYEDDGLIKVILGGWYAVYEAGHYGTMVEFEDKGAQIQEMNFSISVPL